MPFVGRHSVNIWECGGITLGVVATALGLILLPRYGIYSLNVWELSALDLAGAAAGLVRGLSGFGSAMVLFPLLAIPVGPVVAAPVTQALDSSLTLPLLRKAFQTYARREVLPAVVGAVLFVPIGVWLLFFLDGVLLRKIAAAVIIIIVGARARGWKYHGQPTVLTAFGVGALSGVMGGSTTLSGPPVVLFWLGGQADSETVRANVIVFLALSEAWTLILYSFSGLYTWAPLALIFGLAGPFGIGIWAGARIKKHVSERIFKTLALLIIGLSAVASLVG